MAAIDSLDFFDLTQGPNFDTEERMMRAGNPAIAGVDEAGRGPLAGPVVAASVILDPNNIPDGLDDSKKLSEARREAMFAQLVETADCAWASLPAAVIDRSNIRAASLRAMEVAVASLPQKADAVLIDGKDVPDRLAHVGRALVKGDARSLSIAAASIVAKVIRDRMMVRASHAFPGYGFDRHKGYGSKLHREAISALGPCALHRRSFAPIKDMVSVIQT